MPISFLLSWSIIVMIFITTTKQKTDIYKRYSGRTTLGYIVEDIHVDSKWQEQLLTQGIPVELPNRLAFASQKVLGIFTIECFKRF